MAGKKLKKSGQKLIPSLNSQTYLNSSDTELNQEWTNVISLYTELQRLMQTCSLNSETLHNKKKIPNTLESGGLNRELGNSRSKSTKGGVKLSRNIVRKNKVVCKHQLKTFQKLSSTDTSCNKSKCVIAKSNARIIKPSEIQANATCENIFKNKEPDPLIFIKEETNILQDANPNKLENNPEKPCPIGRKEEVNFFSKVDNNNMNIEHIKQFCLASGGLETQMRKLGGCNNNSFGIKFSKGVIQQLYNKIYYYNDVIKSDNENLTSVRFNLSYESCLNNTLKNEESQIENKRLCISCRKSKSLGDLLPLIKQKAPLTLSTGCNNSFSSGNIQFYSLVNKEFEANIEKLIRKINYDCNSKEENSPELLQTLISPCWNRVYTVDSYDHLNKGINEICVQTAMGSYSNNRQSKDELYNDPYGNYVYPQSSNTETKSTDSQKVLTSPKGVYQTKSYRGNSVVQKVPYTSRSVSPSQVHKKKTVYATDESYGTQNIQTIRRNEEQKIIYDDQNVVYQPQEPYPGANMDAIYQPEYDQQIYYPQERMSLPQQGYPTNEGYRTSDGSDNVTILYKPDEPKKLVYEPGDVYQANNNNQTYSYGEPQTYPNNKYAQGNAQQVPATYNVTDLPEKQDDSTCRSEAKCTCCKFCECYKRQNNEEYDSHDYNRSSFKSDKSKSSKSAKEQDWDYPNAEYAEYADNAENAESSYKSIKSDKYDVPQDTYDDYADNASKENSNKASHSKTSDEKNSTAGLLDTYTYEQGTEVDEPYDEPLPREESLASSHKSSKYSENQKDITPTQHKMTQNEHDYTADDINPEDMEDVDDMEEEEDECETKGEACDIFPLGKKKEKKKKKKEKKTSVREPPPSEPKRNFIYEPKPRNTPTMIEPFVVPKPCIPSIPAPCYFPPSCCPLPCTPCPPKCAPIVCPPKCPPKCPPSPCPSPNQTALSRTMQFQPPGGSSNGKNNFLSRNKLNSICAYNVVGTKPKLTLGNVKVMKKSQPKNNAADNSTDKKRGITCETVVTSKGRVTVCKWDNEENEPQTNEENLHSKNHLKSYKVRPSKSDSMLVQAKNHNFKCLTYEIKDPITKINKTSKICFENGNDIVDYLSKGVQTQSVLPVKLTKNSPVHTEPKYRFSCKNNKPQINKNTSPTRKFIEPKKKEKTWYSHHRMDSVETQTTRSYNPQKNRSIPLPAKTIRRRYIYVPKYIRNKENLKEIMNMENKSLNSDKMKPNNERIPRTMSTGMNTDDSAITRTVCTYTKENACANKKSSKTSIGLSSRENNSLYKINTATSTIKEMESIPVKKNKSSMQMQRINSQMNKEKEKYVVKMCGTDPITKVSTGTQSCFQNIDKIPSKTLIPKILFESPAEQSENENPLINTINGINNYICDYLKPKGINENKGDLKSRSKSIHKIQFECSLNDSGKPHCYAVHRNLSPTSGITLPSVATSEHIIKNQTNKNEANKKFGNIICQHLIHKDLNENFIHTNSSENIVNLFNDLNTRKDSKKSIKDDVLLETNTINGKLKEENDASLSKPHDTVKFCCPGCSSDYQCCKETTQHIKKEQKNTDEDSSKLKEKKLNSGMDNICVNVKNETSIDYDATKKQLSLYTACCSENKKEENRSSVDAMLYKNGQKFRLGNKSTNTGSGCSILPVKKVNRGCSAFDVSPKTNTSTSMSQNDVFPKENIQPINEDKPKNKIFDTLDFTDGLTHMFLKYLNQNARRLVFDRINQDNSISSIEDIMESILNSAFVVKTKVQKSKKLKKESNAHKRKRKLLKIKAKLKQQKSRDTSKESTKINQSIQSIKQSSAELNKEHRIKLAEPNSRQSSNNKEVVAKILTKNESPKENKSDFIQNVSKQQALCETEIIKTLSEMSIRSSKKTIQSNLSQPNSSTNKFSNNRRSQIKLITSLQQLYGKHLPSDQKKREKSKISSSNDKSLKGKIKREVTKHEAPKLENTPKPETSNLNATNLSGNINRYYSSQKDGLSMDQNSITDYDKKQIETFSFNSQNMSNNEKLPDRGQSDEISEHIFGRTKPNYIFNNILDHLLSSNKPSLNEFSRDEFSDNYQFSIADGKICDEDIQLSIQKLESYGETADLKSKVSIDTEKGDKGIENNKTQTSVISHNNVPVHNVGHKDWHSPQISSALKKNETLTTFVERNICSQRYLTDPTKVCQDDIRKIDVLIKKPKNEGLEHRINKHDEKMQINTNFEVSNENDFCTNKTHNIEDAKIQYVRVNAGHKNWCNTKKKDEDLDQKPAVVTAKKTLNNNEPTAPALSQENIKPSKSITSNDNKTKESDTQNGIQSCSKPQKSSPTTPFNHSKEVPVNTKISIEDKLTIKIDNLEKDILNSSYLQLGANKCSNSTLINPGNNNNTQTNSNKQSNALSENTSQKKVTDRESPLSQKRQLDLPSELSFQSRISPPLQNDYDSELYLTPWVLGVPYNTANIYKNEDLNDKDAMTNINVTKYHDKNSIQNTDIVNTSDCTRETTGFTNINKNNSKQSNIEHETTKTTEVIINDRDKTKHTNIEEADKPGMAKINELKDNDKFYKQINNSNEKDNYEISTIGKVKTTNIVTNNNGSNTDMLNITEVNTNTGKDNTKEKTIANDTDGYKTPGMSENKLTAKEEFLNIDNVSDKRESKYPSTDKITIHSNDMMNFDQGVTEKENSTAKNSNSTSDTNQDHLKTNERENDLEETNQSYNHEIDCEICNQYKNDLKFTFKHNKDQSGKDSIKSSDIQPCIPQEKLILKQPSSVGSYERLGDKSDHFLEQITAALEAECKKQADQNSNKYKHKFKEFHYNRKRQENDKEENLLLKTFNKTKLNPHQNKTNDTLKQLNIDVLHRQENNTIINQVITSTKKTPQIFIKENKDLVASEPKSQIKEKQLKNINISKNEHNCNQLACLVCSREENEILCFRPSTSKAPTKPGQDLFVSANQLNSLKQNMQVVQDESKHQYKSAKLESELTNMAQDRFAHSHTPTIKIEIKNNPKEQCRTENDYGAYYAQPIAKWQVTPSIESILKCTQGPSQHKSKKNDKLNGMEKNTKIRDEQIAKRKSSKKKTEQLLDNIKLEKRKKSHKISNDQESFFPIFESESYKNFVSTMVGSGHQPKSNELNMPKLSSKKTKNPIYSTITKTKTPSCSYSTSSASRIQPRAEGDSYQQTSTYVTFPCFTINDVFSFSLDSTEKSHLSKTAFDTYLKSLHELSSTLDDQLKLMKFALDEENLKLISHFHANSSSGYSKERSRQLYMHLVSVDKSTKQRNQDCDGVSSPRLADSSQPQYSKYDSNSQKSNSKYKVSKSTMLYVQKELSTLKSQIDQTPYLHLREEIISNKSLTDIEHKYLIESIDEQLEKLKSIEKEIDDLIHELKHSIEGGKDYSLSNGGPAEKNNCLKMESSKNEITFQERLKHIEEILQNELIRIQTALKENEELTESTSKETKNYLKITTGARKRHRERAAKDRSNAKKESFIEKFRRRFSDKKKNSLNTRKK